MSKQNVLRPTPLGAGVVPANFGENEIDLFELLRERRGWTDEFLTLIDNPSHDTMLSLDKMLDRLKEIHESQELLVIVPDFDMDGITSGVLGYAGFSELGFNVAIHIPDYNRGHDVTAEDILEIKAQFPSVKAIITCDGGVNSHEGIETARQLGMTTLVTDHHVELEPGSNADIVVDPSRIDETYSNPGICGAHVLYQVIEAWTMRYQPRKINGIHMLKLFAGIGTVSDVMPLVFENRQLVRDSLSLARLLYVAPPANPEDEMDVTRTTLMTLLENGGHHPAFVSAFRGASVALAEYTKSGKLRTILDIDEGFYGFYLAPAFNAARRINGSMVDCFGVFLADTAEAQSQHMQNVLAGNELRKELLKTHLEELEQTEQPLAPYVYLSSAPAGMLGLIANHLMQISGVPTVVLHTPDNDDEPTSGSARSPFWFSVIETMTPEGFTAVGHENACGVRVKNSAEIQRFYEVMSEKAHQIMSELVDSGEMAKATAPDLRFGPTADSDVSLSNIEAILTMTEQIERLMPFGQGFLRPEFELVLDLAQCHISLLGSEQTHIRIVTRSGLKCLWWNAADQLMDLKERAASLSADERELRVRVAFSINVFRDNRSVQATIERVL